ncbi:MAG: type II toxin-antitoxin system death-on-curing family toxin [Phycisphaerales bacterium]|nr:type II toxin-antitoxin system death-on-curing family toxin [Phycisphaerales bacterium]
MPDPYFLDLGRIAKLHAELIEIYGGMGGIRDIGLLSSTIDQPQATFAGQYLHADLFEMASAYLFHIVKNHPFFDGNKRTGAASAIVFLDMNGVLIEPDEDALVDITLRVAEGTATKAEVTEFFRARADRDESV